MKTLKIFIALVFITIQPICAKDRIIPIKEDLKNASKISKIIVYGYNDTTMFYRYIGKKDTLKLSCEMWPISMDARMDLLGLNMIRPTDLIGSWPKAGDTVLVVIDKNNKVALFAKNSGKYYRFWDPILDPYSRSVFSIVKEPAYKPLPDCDANKNPQDKFWICTDGCLILKTAVKEK